MKKTLLLLTSCVLSQFSYSQVSIELRNVATSATIAANTVINLTTSASNNTQFTFDIKNISNGTRSYNAKRYDITLNNGADAYFCFAGTCYGSNVLVSPTPLSLSAGQSASQLSGNFNMLVADLDEGASVGLSVIKYTFINTQLSSDSIQVTLRYNVPTSIKQTNSLNSSFSLNPNPTSNQTKVKFSSNTNSTSTIKLINSLGQIVFEKNHETVVGENTVDLNLDNYSTGAYFVTIENTTSKVAKKLIITK